MLTPHPQQWAPSSPSDYTAQSTKPQTLAAAVLKHTEYKWRRRHLRHNFSSKDSAIKVDFNNPKDTYHEIKEKLQRNTDKLLKILVSSANTSRTPKLFIHVTAGHVKNFSLGQHRQSYLTLSLKHHKPWMAESHNISGYLRKPWEKGAPEIPREVRIEAQQRF